MCAPFTPPVAPLLPRPQYFFLLLLIFLIELVAGVLAYVYYQRVSRRLQALQHSQRRVSFTLQWFPISHFVASLAPSVLCLLCGSVAPRVNQSNLSCCALRTKIHNCCVLKAAWGEDAGRLGSMILPPFFFSFSSECF